MDVTAAGIRFPGHRGAASRLSGRRPPDIPFCLTKQGQTITVGGLERSTSESLHSQLHSRVEEILNDVAAKKAIILGPEITDLRDAITSHLAPDRYLRRSHTAGMTPSVRKLAEQLDERARQKLNADAGQALRCVNGGAEVFHAGG